MDDLKAQLDAEIEAKKNILDAEIEAKKTSPTSADAQLKAEIESKKSQYEPSTTTKILDYALNRGVTPSDVGGDSYWLPKDSEQTSSEGMDRYAGAVLRGVAPTVAESGVGALGGGIIGGALTRSPQGVIQGAKIGAQAGPLAGQLSDLAISLTNTAFGTHYKSPKEAVTHLLDKIGVPEPESSSEKIVEAVSAGTAEMGTGAVGAKALAKIIPVGKIQKVAQFLGEKPVEQAVAGASAGAAGETARQMGAGAGWQLAAALGGGLAPSIVTGATKYGLKLLPPSEAKKTAQAKELAKSTLEASVIDKEQAIQSLEKARDVSDESVKLMAGDITGDPRMLQLQNKLRSISSEMMKRDIENISGISQKLGKGLEETAVSPQETQTYFKNQLDDFAKQTEAIKQSVIASGDTESARILDEAAKYSAQQSLLAEQGVLTAEEAMRNASSKLQDLNSELLAQKNAVIKDDLSSNVSNVIENQRAKEKIKINNLYIAAEQKVPPFLQQNTLNSKKELIKQFGEERRLPSEVKKILSEVADQEGNLIPRTLPQLRADIQAINAEIRSAQSSAARQAEVPALIKFKKALNADMDALGNVNEDLRKANRAYYEYAQRYKEGASSKAFGPKSDVTKVINEYIPSGVKAASPIEIQRLRNAIIGDQTIPKTPEIEADIQKGIQGVSQWIYSSMADSIKGSKNSDSIRNWINTGGKRILNVFPEARGQVYETLQKFESLEDAVKQAQEGISKAKLDKIVSGENATLANQEAKNKITLLNQQSKRIQDELFDELQTSLNPKSNPAARFVGGNPYEIVGKIMTDKVNVENNVQNILEQVSQDPTGKAMEGLQNAFKGWLNSQARTTSEETVGIGVKKPIITNEDLQVNLQRMNNLLIEGSAERNVLESVFGKDSYELANLDKVRQQLDILSKRGAASMAESVPVEKLGEGKKSEVKDTLLSLAAIGGAGVKGYLAFKTADLFKKIQKTYKEDTLQLFRQMLVDAMVDPEVARTMLLEPTKQNMPAIQSLLQTYGVSLKAATGAVKEDQEEE